MLFPVVSSRPRKPRPQTEKKSLARIVTIAEALADADATFPVAALVSADTRRRQVTRRALVLLAPVFIVGSLGFGSAAAGILLAHSPWRSGSSGDRWLLGSKFCPSACAERNDGRWSGTRTAWRRRSGTVRSRWSARRGRRSWQWCPPSATLSWHFPPPRHPPPSHLRRRHPPARCPPAPHRTAPPGTRQPPGQRRDLSVSGGFGSSRRRALTNFPLPLQSRPGGGQKTPLRAAARGQPASLGRAIRISGTSSSACHPSRSTRKATCRGRSGSPWTCRTNTRTDRSTLFPSGFGPASFPIGWRGSNGWTCSPRSAAPLPDPSPPPERRDARWRRQRRASKPLTPRRRAGRPPFLDGGTTGAPGCCGGCSVYVLVGLCRGHRGSRSSLTRQVPVGSML
jgi:hypothetical protein